MDLSILKYKQASEPSDIDHRAKTESLGDL